MDEADDAPLDDYAPIAQLYDDIDPVAQLDGEATRHLREPNRPYASRTKSNPEIYFFRFYGGKHLF